MLKSLLIILTQISDFSHYSFVPISIYHHILTILLSMIMISTMHMVIIIATENRILPCNVHILFKYASQVHNHHCFKESFDIFLVPNYSRIMLVNICLELLLQPMLSACLMC